MSHFMWFIIVLYEQKFTHSVNQLFNHSSIQSFSHSLIHSIVMQSFNEFNTDFFHFCFFSVGYYCCLCRIFPLKTQPLQASVNIFFLLVVVVVLVVGLLYFKPVPEYIVRTYIYAAIQSIDCLQWIISEWVPSKLRAVIMRTEQQLPAAGNFFFFYFYNASSQVLIMVSHAACFFFFCVAAASFLFSPFPLCFC